MGIDLESDERSALLRWKKRADEVRVEHEAEIRRMWLPVGARTKVYVDRDRAAMSFFGALNLHSGKVELSRIEGKQDTEQIILTLDRLQRAYPGKRLVIVWDNASWHKSKELKKHLGEGNLFENITLVQLPPYAPEHNPVEHVWNDAKKRFPISSARHPISHSVRSSHISGAACSNTISNISRFDVLGPILFNFGYGSDPRAGRKH